MTRGLGAVDQQQRAYLMYTRSYIQSPVLIKIKSKSTNNKARYWKNVVKTRCVAQPHGLGTCEHSSMTEM